MFHSSEITRQVEVQAVSFRIQCSCIFYVWQTTSLLVRDLFLDVGVSEEYQTYTKQLQQMVKRLKSLSSEKSTPAQDCSVSLETVSKQKQSCPNTRADELRKITLSAVFEKHFTFNPSHPAILNVDPYFSSSLPTSLSTSLTVCSELILVIA